MIPKIKSDEDLDNNVMKKTKKNFLWIQEFSKKVIMILVILYIIYFFASLYGMYKMIQNDNLIGFESMTNEINETFRFIVGGYLIKAALENITKIGGNYYGSVAKIKLIKDKKAQGLDVEEDLNQLNNELNDTMMENMTNITSNIDEL